MGIGVAFKCKINSNIGNSATTSNIEEELKKLHHSVHYGADTVMDLSTAAIFPRFAKRSSRPRPCDRDRADYEALSRVKRNEDLTIGLMLEVIESRPSRAWTT